ncbi:MAG TPA: hypothetical protein VFS40_15660 [Gemmatimonadales bacterium]|nr:hypothetical protein [Gemmatimonadales bacterium]
MTGGAAAPARPRFAGPVPVDAHVHYHACFDPLAFLEGARGHFARVGCVQRRGEATLLGILCFTESAGARGFASFAACAAAGAGTGPAGPTPHGWRLTSTAEARALLAWRGPEAILLLAGRQIVTAEGLEVLALGCARELPDGRPLGKTVEAVRAADALAVLPWGFGKWTGRRGRVVEAYLRDAAREVALGDNGGRPRRAPRPRLLTRAAALGRVVLPGSDPLPFPSQTAAAGRYGFLLEGELDAERPGRDLIDLLRGLERQPCTYGRLESWTGFLVSQLRMQWRRRRPRLARRSSRPPEG